MTIDRFIKTNSIERVVHFTTNIGLIGVLNTQTLKSRDRLNADEYLSHILHNNCETRKDPAWTDYISMSIQSPNKMFLHYANRWEHNREFWWCILSFSPEILTHEGVVFCTTNNSYSGAVKRGKGIAGLKALYADEIPERHPYIQRRTSRTPLANPTAEQAEVLYPGELTLEYLENIYLPEAKYEAEVAAYLSGARLSEIPYSTKMSFF